MVEESRIVVALLGTAGLFYLLVKLTQYNSTLRRWVRAKRKPWVKVGEISKILLHPVKSCRGLSVDWAWCGEAGLQHNEMIDRHLMIWDRKQGQKVSAREIPQTLFIEPLVQNGILILQFRDEDSRRLSNRVEFSLEDIMKAGQVEHANLWKADISGYDCGDAVSQWLCTRLQAAPLSLRLLYYSSELDNLNGRGLDVSMKTHKPAVHTVLQSLGRTDKVIFPDAAPFELGTEESLRDLNGRLDKALTFRQFRPNFIVKGTPKAFDEDDWDQIQIGTEARFSHILRCDRCILTTIDPDTATKDLNSEPLKTLRTYRLAADSEREVYKYAPLFGIKLGIDAVGRVNVGDHVYVTYK